MRYLTPPILLQPWIDALCATCGLPAIEMTEFIIMTQSLRRNNDSQQASGNKSGRVWFLKGHLLICTDKNLSADKTVGPTICFMYK